MFLNVSAGGIPIGISAIMEHKRKPDPVPYRRAPYLPPQKLKFILLKKRARGTPISETNAPERR